MSRGEFSGIQKAFLLAEILVQNWDRVWIVVVSVLVLAGVNVRVGVGVGMLTVVLILIFRAVLVVGWGEGLSVPDE